MCGVAVGAMALVCVLSVINGFENVVQESFSNFDPDLRIRVLEGKTFSANDDIVKGAFNRDEVELFCPVLIEDAMIQYRDEQMPAKVMGVGSAFHELTDIDSIMWQGDANFNLRSANAGILGIGLANKLKSGVDFSEGSVLYAPRRVGRINLARPDASFRKTPFFTCGVFYTGQTKYDDNMVIFPIALVRDAYEYGDSVVTSIDIKLSESADIKKVQAAMRSELGDRFIVENRYEQQADFYRILKIEKWTTFLILSFILLIATFNVIGSMSMLMIDKKDDVGLFRSLGASDETIRRLFIFEGWMISAIGAVAGIILGIAVCLVQENFGIIKIGSGYIVDEYPVALRLGDVFIVLVTVLALGFLSAVYPVKSALKMKL
jgi:lipoprotein-releasing system permease protein